MFSDLSDRRQGVLKYIGQYFLENSYPPSYREIQAALEIASTATVSKDVHHLINEGYLTMDPNNYRSIQLVEDKIHEYMNPDDFLARTNEAPSISAYRDDVFDIPIYGDVAAGSPIYADDYVEDTVPLPSDFFRKDHESYFILTISGDSMIEAGIFDGDHVIVRKQDIAKDGDQVVALIEDSATVKTFFKHPDHVELRPENQDMESIRVQECQILGVVCGLYRLY